MFQSKKTHTEISKIKLKIKNKEISNSSRMVERSLASTNRPKAITRWKFDSET